MRILSQTQLAVTESAPHGQAAYSGLQYTGQEAEEVLSGVLKMIQHAMVKRRSYEAI